MSGNERHQFDSIDRQSTNLAHMMDQGQGQQVAQILREDSRSMSAHDFNRLVRETERKDDKRYGDNLTIVPQENVIIIDGNKGEILVGNMRDERSTRGRDVVECPDPNKAVGHGALAGGALGAIAGGVIKGNRSGMGWGAVIGAVGGAIVGSEHAQNDCVIVHDQPERR